MGDIQEIGEFGKLQIEWRIVDYFSVTEKSYRCASPAFSIRDVQWHLKLWTDYTAGPQKGISVFLESDEKRSYSVEYNFGLKKCDGSVEQLVSGFLKKKAKGSEELFLIEKTELERRKSELAPSNCLTIICTLSLVSEVNTPRQQTVIGKSGPLKLINLDKLSANFKDLFYDKESCDVTLKVKDKEFRAHRCVLMARSSVLAANFKHEMLEKETGVITIPDCDPDSFQEFLAYLYCGKLEELSYRSAMNLYYTSEKYDVKEVKAFCVEYLMLCLTVENVCEIAVFADTFEETQLFSVVQDFFNKNYLKIFLTTEWQHLLKNNYLLVNKFLTQMAKRPVKE